MKSTIFKYISVITIIGAFILILYSGFLLLQEPKILDISTPMQTDKESYKIGEKLIYRADFCKYKNYPVVSFQRTLVDGYSIVLPDGDKPIILPLGCNSSDFEVLLSIPDGIPLNHKYRVVITITYQINPFKQKVEQYSTEEFILKR